MRGWIDMCWGRYVQGSRYVYLDNIHCIKKCRVLIRNTISNDRLVYVCRGGCAGDAVGRCIGGWRYFRLAVPRLYPWYTCMHEVLIKGQETTGWWDVQ